VLRDLRAFGRIAVRLGWRDRGSRRAFWGAVLDCLLHNPRALKISVSFAALYLHVGPFSRWLVERLDRQVLEQEQEQEQAQLPAVAHAPREASAPVQRLGGPGPTLSATRT
jgi:hypothetical protein